jgi:hypothetical protein
MDCGPFREVAAELALGILPGPDWPAALAHMGRCARCQAEVASLAYTADQLLDLIPARGAPDGLENRVTAAFGRMPPLPDNDRRWARPARWGFSSRQWRPFAVASALAAAGMLGFWLNGIIITQQPPSYEDAVVAALRTPGGAPAGQVAVTGTRQRWLVMVVNASAAPGWYHCYVRTSRGQEIPVGTFRVGPDGGVWVSPLPVPQSQLTGARLVGPGHVRAASASFG